MPKKLCPTRVLLVSDRLLFREGLTLMIDRQENMQVAASVSNTREAVMLLDDRDPDVAIIESSLSGQLSFSRVRESRNLWPDVRIMLIASDPGDAITSTALCAQVDGIVTTSDAFQAVVAAVNAVLAGRRHYTPAISNRLAKQRSSESSPPPLTPREFEVLGHLATGRTVKETAAAMELAATTVDNHKTRIMRKVDVHNAVGLLRFAIREGIVTP